MTLTAEQDAAADLPPDSHVCIQARAGSGKTTTIIERIARFVERQGKDPSRILLTTFTREAVRECRRRLNARLRVAETPVMVCTLDSLCRSMLLEMDPARRDAFLGVQEFAGLALELLHSTSQTKNFDYVVVDEFQDLSVQQMQLVRLLCDRGCWLTAVGDSTQNIYEWRDCHEHHLTRISHYVPGMRHFCYLTVNHRCSPEIVRFGNHVLAKLEVPMDRRMTSSRPETGTYPVVERLTVRGGWCRDRAVAGRVVSLCLELRARGVALHDVAVLVRSKTQGNAIVESIVLHNASKREPHERVRYVSALSLDEDCAVVGTSAVVPDHVTVMTVHQMKGGERDVIIAPLWNPSCGTSNSGINREELRLFNVCVTRARHRLHLLHAGPLRSRLPALFFDGVPASAYSLVDPDASEREHVTSICAQPDPDDDYFVGLRWTQSVTKLLKKLTYEDYDAMRRSGTVDFLQSQAVVTSLRSPDANSFLIRKSHEALKREYLHVEFGSFVDRVISRMLWETDSSPNRTELRDLDADHLFRTLHVSLYTWKLFRRYHVRVSAHLSVPRASRDSCEWVHELQASGIASKELKALVNLVTSIDMHAAKAECEPTEVVVRVGRSYFRGLTVEARARLYAAYSAYRDPSVRTASAMHAVFLVSLSSSLLQYKRSSMYDRSVFTRFERLLRLIMPNVRVFCEYLTTTTTTMTTTTTSARLLVKPLLSSESRPVQGEADVVDLRNRIIYDVKCSSTSPIVDKMWFMQLLAYKALLDSSRVVEAVEAVSVFNPLTGMLWKMPVRDWSHGDELLDVLGSKVYG